MIDLRRMRFSRPRCSSKLNKFNGKSRYFGSRYRSSTETDYTNSSPVWLAAVYHHSDKLITAGKIFRIDPMTETLQAELLAKVSRTF